MSWYKNIVSQNSGSTRRMETSQTHTDVALMRRFLEGDNVALVELFDRHNHRLYLFALQFVNDPQRAEDVTQELWERMIRLRAEGKATPDNPLGLLLTIVRNLCLDAIRRDRRFTTIDELPETLHPTVSMPELSHMEELVILALPHLPLQQREVLVLHAYSGYRFDEIAQMLGEPVGAIRTRAWRARAHLGRIISAMIGIDEDNQSLRGQERPGDEE